MPLFYLFTTIAEGEKKKEKRGDAELSERGAEGHLPLLYQFPLRRPEALEKKKKKGKKQFRRRKKGSQKEKKDPKRFLRYYLYPLSCVLCFFEKKKKNERGRSGQEDEKLCLNFQFRSSFRIRQGEKGREGKKKK